VIAVLDIQRNNLDISSSPFFNAFYYYIKWKRRLALECFLTPNIHPIFALCMIKDEFEILLGKTLGLHNFIK